MRTGRVTAVLLSVFFGILFPHGVRGMNQISTDVFSENIVVTDDTHIVPGVSVVADTINIIESVRLFNEADIRGNVNVCDGCDLVIRNSGTYVGRVHLGADATMTQLVRGIDDLTHIDVDGSYVVLADCVRDISWGELAALGEYAGTLVVRDSRVVLSDLSGFAVRMRQSAQIILRGTVTLVLPQGYGIDDAPVIENVAGDASVVIESASPDPLHAFMTTVRDGNLYISLVRETDYYKILGDWRGRLLNKVRDVRPDDALLARMDSATSMDELEYIISHSVAFNPMRMLRPMRIMDSFMTDSVVVGVQGGVPFGSLARPFYISADDESVVGALTDFYLRLGGGLEMGASIYAGAGENDDDINAFSVTMFGGRAFANYNRGYFNMRALAGATYADFEVPYIFHDGQILDSAHGRSEYGVVDAGVKIGVVTPYVGVGARREHMLGLVKNYIAARAGLSAAYRVRVSDVGYEYKMDAGTDTLGRMHAGVGIDFWAPDDGIGGGISVDSMHEPQGMAYMFSLNMRMRF